MNKMQFTSKWSDFFIKIEFIICFLIVLCTVTKNSNQASIFFTLSFIVLLVFLFITLLKYKFKKNEIIKFILLINIVLIAVVAILLNFSSISLSFDYFKKYIMFCCTVIFLFIASIVKVNKKTLNFILILNIFLGYLYIYIYFFKERAYMGKYLTLNFTSPNLTALWITQTILYIFIAMIYFKKGIIRIASITCIAFLSFFLFETGARTSLITLAFFIILSLYIFLKRNIKINKFIIAILVLSPILVSIFYFILIQNGNISVINFMDSEGKSVYSRQGVWTYAFEAIKAHPILGAYYEISDGTGMSQMHNTHIDVLASYGVIVFVLLMFYMISIVININVKCKSKLQTISIIAFLVVIVNGMGEAALFSGGQGIYILSCSFLLFAGNLDLISDNI